MPETYRVIKAHQSPDPDPLILRKGDRLTFELSETEWPGWMWCTDDSGKSAWVPENWVKIQGEFCVLQRDYNATELSVEVGEMVTVEFEESNWAWVARQDGKKGWVPLQNLQTNT